MPAVLVAVPAVTQNSLHPLSTSSIMARHLLDFVEQGKITEADAPTICLTPPIRTIGAPSPPSPHFYAECHFCRNPPDLSCLRAEASNNADGLHTQWLD